MIHLTKIRQAELARLCRLHHVHQLELFGSGTTNKSDSEIHDLDFLVEFEELDLSDYADAYFGLMESLQDLFGKPIDLVMRSAIDNPYLLQSIEQNRAILYVA